MPDMIVDGVGIQGHTLDLLKVVCTCPARYSAYVIYGIVGMGVHPNM